MRVAAAIFSTFLRVSPLSAGEPFVDLSFDAACQQAADEGKLVFIEFFVPNDAACADFDRAAWSDAWIVEVVRDKSVAIRIDATGNDELARRLGVTEHPALLLVKPDGAIVDRLTGDRDTGTFLYEFEAAIQGKDSLTRARDLHRHFDEKSLPAKLDYAGELVRHQRYAEALTEYLECFDLGRDLDRHFWGTRAGTLPDEIVRLGRVYPPARQALLDRRAERERLLIDGRGDYVELAELDAINQALDEPWKTLEVYDQMPKTSAAWRGALPIVFEPLLEARRYPDIVAHQADSVAIVQQKIESAEQAATPSFMTRNFLRGHELAYEEYVRWIRRRPVETAAEWVEVYAGVGDAVAARGLVRKILEYDASAKTFETLLAHARRAENEEVVSYLLELQAARSAANKG